MTIYIMFFAVLILKILGRS